MRSAPATTASTTSLTVPPKAFLTVLKSSRLAGRPRTKRRCGPIGTFSGVSGAGFRPAQTISPTPSAASRARASARSGWASASIAPSASATPVRTAPRSPAASSWAVPGSGCGCHGRPGVGDRRRVGREVEQDRREVDARDAVDQRVVGLGDQREAVVLEALDQPHLPQRLRAVELLGEDPRGQVLQLLPAARRGQRGVADVVLEVEARVVDPHGAAAVERRVGELVPVAGNEVQPPADLLEELVHRRRRPFDDRQAADVHVRDRALLVQERGVYRGQPIEVTLAHRALSVPGRPLQWQSVANTVEKLLLAAPRGYCAGVDRAVQTVRTRAGDPRRACLRAQGDRPQQARRRAAARARRDLRR